MIPDDSVPVRLGPSMTASDDGTTLTCNCGLQIRGSTRSRRQIRWHDHTAGDPPHDWVLSIRAEGYEPYRIVLGEGYDEWQEEP